MHKNEIGNNHAFCLFGIIFCQTEDGWVISSESCGFLSMGAKYVRDVYPGEIVECTKEGFHTVSIMGRPHNRPQALCIFEYVYFARPDSIYEGSKFICLFSVYH